MDINTLSLGKEFNESNVRICTIDGIKHIAIYDLISAICQVKNQHDMFMRLKAENNEILQSINSFQFPGRGQKNTPISNIETATEIIMILPGKRAKQYRKAAVRSLLNVMNPSEDFIKEITERFELQQDELSKKSIFSNEDKSVYLSPRAYNDTHIYVRIRFPDEYIRPTDNRKTLTLNILKFGIAY